MAIHKNNFQPKDARAISNMYQEDDEDMDDLFPTRKMMTGTQALVEFLKTTSPEEFQRPERSTNIFSRMRRTKRVPSLSARSVPPTSANGTKKSYVELVPKSAGNSRAPSFEAASIQSFVLRPSKSSTATTKDPILPNKKRESSLYSESLRHSLSIKSQLSTGRRLLSSHPDSHKIARVATDSFLKASEGSDTVETALLQRLERIRILDQPIPSDQVAAGLATEHIRALGITHVLEQSSQEVKKDNIHHGKKVRHMQVQTMDVEHSTNPIKVSETKKESEEDETEIRRLEAALDETLDNFEVICGLAYKKLRELWEEKMRWENACMEFRDRLLALEQDKRYHDNDYFLEEEEEEGDKEDDLGLSEFPVN